MVFAAQSSRHPAVWAPETVAVARFRRNHSAAICLILSRVPDSSAERDVGDSKCEIIQALVLMSEGEEDKIGRVLWLYWVHSR